MWWALTCTWVESWRGKNIWAAAVCPCILCSALWGADSSGSRGPNSIYGMCLFWDHRNPETLELLPAQTLETIQQSQWRDQERLISLLLESSALLQGTAALWPSLGTSGCCWHQGVLTEKGCRAGWLLLGSPGVCDHRFSTSLCHEGSWQHKGQTAQCHHPSLWCTETWTGTHSEISEGMCWKPKAPSRMRREFTEGIIQMRLEGSKPCNMLFISSI